MLKTKPGYMLKLEFLFVSLFLKKIVYTKPVAKDNGNYGENNNGLFYGAL